MVGRPHNSNDDGSENKGASETFRATLRNLDRKRNAKKTEVIDAENYTPKFNGELKSTSETYSAVTHENSTNSFPKKLSRIQSLKKSRVIDTKNNTSKLNGCLLEMFGVKVSLASTDMKRKIQSIVLEFSEPVSVNDIWRKNSTLLMLESFSTDIKNNSNKISTLNKLSDKLISVQLEVSIEKQRIKQAGEKHCRFRVYVVRPEIFESALREIQHVKLPGSEEALLRYELYYPASCRMVIAIPVYNDDTFRK